MDHLTQIFLSFMSWSKSNPLIAGAVSLWGLSVITFVFRRIPQRIISFIVRQCTTTVTLTSIDEGRNKFTYGNFMKWFENNAITRLSRSIQIDPNWAARDGTTVSIGPGRHYFRYGGRLFWLNRSMLAGNQREVTYQLVITTYGRNRALMLQLIDEFRYKAPAERFTSIYAFDKVSATWKHQAFARRRPLDTVILNRDLKAQIIKTVEDFSNEESWYIERGLNYKKTAILHGNPGGGKTSLIKALADHFLRDIYVINLNEMTDSTLRGAIMGTGNNSIVVIEDFDTSRSTAARSGMASYVSPLAVTMKAVAANAATVSTGRGGSSKEVAEPAKALESQTDPLEGLIGVSLSGLLNALDGVAGLHNTLILMTTNRLDTVDPAILRKGRVDHIWEIGAFHQEEIQAYYNLMFPDHPAVIPSNVQPIMGCDLQDLYFQHKYDAKAFIAAIPVVDDSVGSEARDPFTLTHTDEACYS